MSTEGALRTTRGYDFFQLVTLLQRAAPGRAQVGHLGNKGSDLDEELIRLRPNLSMQFPARDVALAEPIEHTPGRASRVRLDINFLGLYGPDGCLPSRFTERLLRDASRAPQEDRGAARDFLDIFHHRFYSLLFRSWQKYRYHAGFRSDGSDRTSQHLMALVGLGTRGLAAGGEATPGLEPLRMLRYGGLSTQRPRSAASLRALLRDYFNDVPIGVRQFQPRSVAIPTESQTLLGGLATGRVPARRLGIDSVVGQQVTEISGKVRIAAGPLGWSAYTELLPGTTKRAALDELVRRTAPRHVEHDVELTLRSAEVPALTLSSHEPARLGWTSWVTSAQGEDQKALFRSGPAACVAVHQEEERSKQ